MSPSRFHLVPQPTFPNQRNDEKIFIYSKRHIVDYLFFVVALSFLALLPIIVLPFMVGSFITSGFLSDVYARDTLVLLIASYYLILEIVFLTSWILYYFNAIVVTDERVVEIRQVGLFSREINELTYEQIEDVTCKVGGILNTLFEVGNIEIQTAGPERNFIIKEVPKPYVTVEVILELASQTRRGVPMAERVPDLATIGVINGRLIERGSKVPPIMNFEKDLATTTQRFMKGIERPRSIREKFDCWWLGHCNQMEATFGNKNDRNEELKKLQDTSKKSEHRGDDMMDL